MAFPALEPWATPPWVLAIYAGLAVAVIRGWVVPGAERLYAAVLLLGGIFSQNAVNRLYHKYLRGNETAVERTLREEVYFWVPLVGACILFFIFGDLWRRGLLPPLVPPPPARRRFGRRA